MRSYPKTVAEYEVEVAAQAATFTASQFLGSGRFDMIDVNLDGELSFPLADLLTGLGVPFAFVTGDSAVARAAYLRRLILAKPFTPDDLRAVLAAL